MVGKTKNSLGAWAFLIGVLVAVIVGIIAFFVNASFPPWATWVLFVLGIVVGLLNISDKEATPFLMAGAVLVIVSAFGKGMFADIVNMILHGLLLLFVPATVIVALKSVFGMAKK